MRNKRKNTHIENVVLSVLMPLSAMTLAALMILITMFFIGVS